jgi:hypothetical protein
MLTSAQTGKARRLPQERALITGMSEIIITNKQNETGSARHRLIRFVKEETLEPLQIDTYVTKVRKSYDNV